MKKEKDTLQRSKKRAVEEVIHGQKSINQAAREVGSVPNTVQKRLEKVQKGQGFQDKPSIRKRALEKENEKLKALIGDLYTQVEFLKKAKTFAQKNKNLNSSIIAGENRHLFKQDSWKKGSQSLDASRIMKIRIVLLRFIL